MCASVPRFWQNGLKFYQSQLAMLSEITGRVTYFDCVKGERVKGGFGLTS
jgi:hypothetical protein